MQLPLGSLEALQKLETHVREHPGDEAAVRAWADALLEVQDPLGEFIVRCFTEVSEPALPEALERKVLGSFRHPSATCVTARGVLREVSFQPWPEWDSEWLAEDEPCWRGVCSLTLPLTASRNPARWLRIIRAAPVLTRLQHAPFPLFAALCEEPRSFDSLTVVGQPIAGVLTPIATPRLRVRALTLPRGFDAESPLRWLLGSARKVFDSLEVLTVPGVGPEDAQALLQTSGPSLLRVEGRHWSARRSAAGGDFCVTVVPVKDLLTQRWELTPPPWIPRESFQLERTPQGALRPLTVTVKAPLQATTARRHLRVAAQTVPTREACPFTRTPWRELVASLCGRPGIEGRVERLQSGAWVLTLRGEHVTQLQQPLPWLPREHDPLLALLPDGFTRTLTNLVRLDDDEPPSAETHGFSADALLAHARLHSDADDAVFQLAVYPTLDAWCAAASEPPGRVVARTEVGALLEELRREAPIDANAEVAAAKRLLARAQARAEDARENHAHRLRDEDMPF